MKMFSAVLALLCACGPSNPPATEGPEETVRVLNAPGEHPTDNELTAPSGSALRAVNVVVDYADKYTSHRGLEASAASGHTLSSFTLYQGDLIAHSEEDGVLLRLHSGSWSTYSGTYHAPSGEVMSFQEAQGSLFFTTSTGVYRLDGAAATPVASGMTQGLLGTVALHSGTGSMLADGYAAAYRSHWALNVDDGGSGRLVEGAPSSRLVVANASGSSKDVDLTFPIPSTLPTGAYLRVFRSDAVPSSISPLDVMGQVYERTPTPTEVSAGTFTFTDDTPDTVKGSSAYWDPNSGDGLAQSNYSAPLASRLSTYADSLFSTGISGVQRLTLNMLGALVVNAGIQLVRGSTTEVYIAGSSEIFPGQFKTFVGTSTPGQDLADTVASLARAINSRTDGVFHAFLVDTDGTNPGAFLLEARDLDQTQFFAYSMGEVRNWIPALPGFNSGSASRTGSTVTVTADIAHGLIDGAVVTIYSSTDHTLTPLGDKQVTVTGDTTFTYTEAGSASGTASLTFKVVAPPVNSSPGTASNGYTWSKRYEPDAVPLTNYGTIADPNDKLWWTQQLDRWNYFGSDAGLFRFSGNADDGFSSPEEGVAWDSTSRFLGRRNVAVLDGVAYAMSRQGLIAWSEGSKPASVDVPIQKEIRDAVSAYPDKVAELGFMFSDSVNHRLYVAMPESSTAAAATLVRVLSFPKGGPAAWTRLTSTFPGLEMGAVDGFASPDTGKAYLLPQGDGSPVDRVGTVLSTRVTGSNADFKGPENQGLAESVTYLPMLAGEPARYKQWTWTRIFTEAPSTALTFGVSTEASPTWTYQSLPSMDASTAPVPVSDPVRSLAWRTIIDSTPDGTSHARAKSLTVQVAHNVAGEPLNLLGVEVKARPYGSGQ